MDSRMYPGCPEKNRVKLLEKELISRMAFLNHLL